MCYLYCSQMNMVLYGSNSYQTSIFFTTIKINKNFFTLENWFIGFTIPVFICVLAVQKILQITLFLSALAPSFGSGRYHKINIFPSIPKTLYSSWGEKSSCSFREEITNNESHSATDGANRDKTSEWLTRLKL